MVIQGFGKCAVFVCVDLHSIGVSGSAPFYLVPCKLRRAGVVVRQRGRGGIGGVVGVVGKSTCKVDALHVFA